MRDIPVSSRQVSLRRRSKLSFAKALEYSRGAMESNRPWCTNANWRLQMPVANLGLIFHSMSSILDTAGPNRAGWIAPAAERVPSAQSAHSQVS